MAPPASDTASDMGEGREAEGSAEDDPGDSSPPAVVLGQSRAESASEGHQDEKCTKQATGDTKAHVEDFIRRTGMRPRTCYRLVLLTWALKIIGGTWMGMVMLEYTRYYIINDVESLSIIETYTASPQCLLKAFLFPFWGIAADRSSRKKIIVASSVAMCMSAWLITYLPSVEILAMTRCLSLIGDIGGSIRNAMLRDLFSPSEWEHVDGGITGIKSRMAVFGTLMAAVAVFSGMGILKLGDMGVFGLPNEYSERKDKLPPYGCQGETYCITPGKHSWENDGWHVDGSLRLMMLMGTLMLTLEALVVVLFLPETLPPAHQTDASLYKFFRRNWRMLGQPWNNLRSFATPQLKALLNIRFLHYAVGSGGNALFMSWYRRHQLDTFTMHVLGIAGGVTGFLLCFGVIRIVDRFGDLAGIWVPGYVMAICQGIGIALVPGSAWELCFIVFPIFLGPAGALQGFMPELLAKLMPADVQATFQTGKSFLHDIQKAVLVWPWLGLFVYSEDLPYPLDALSVWVAIGLGVLALLLTLRELPRDPKQAIEQGRALDEYWETLYVQGKPGRPSWYQRHGGRLVKPRARPSASGPVPDLQERAVVAEGASKVGLFLTSGNDDSFRTYLECLRQLPRVRSLSVVLCYLDGEDLLGQDWGTVQAGDEAPSVEVAADHQISL